jgi:hypothetical protein
MAAAGPVSVALYGDVRTLAQPTVGRVYDSIDGIRLRLLCSRSTMWRSESGISRTIRVRLSVAAISRRKSFY